ncbi:histidine kinase [Rhizocola hellebori]|uniref:histidine kinase n=1 Tax=Rhizocola hellebori TaxID=1392758 RepID=A0A8J3QGB4_9ACTN|nr:histidine kinase [Rhizocola hellebori]GIH10021.1 histidine kinase [Rhizocola hellebori]
MIRRLLSPLYAGTTYRRGFFLLLGGVIVLPYAQLGVVFATLLSDPRTPRAATAVLLVVALVIAFVPAVLRGTRVLEVAAARSLLGVDLPEPAAVLDRETRLRTALWFALHLLTGGLVGLVLLIALPMALVFLVSRFGIGDDLLGPLAGMGWLGLTGVGFALLVVLGYTVAGLGSLAAVMAPVLLGPSTSERIAALEAQAGHLAERNRLARELHDSIGHALTVTTVQAAAAGRVLETDPQFVRQALTAIEETGRAAMEELDHVLGLLRDPAAARGPARTLADLHTLLADAQAAGLTVDASVEGKIDEISVAVSREAYRIVQEGLTNAARHGLAKQASVRVAVSAEALSIWLSNPAGAEAADHGGGVIGMRERVRLLGGRFSAGPESGRWLVRAELPLGRRRG